jgi:hypothetical protein
MPKALLAFFFVLSYFSAKAQIELVLKNETPLSLQLVLNGFTQDAVPAQEYILKNLAEKKEYHLSFINTKDSSVVFSRKLILNQRGVYRYVITQNFAGTYQLRFRGSISQPPNNIASIKYHKEQAFTFPKPKKEPAQALALQIKRTDTNTSQIPKAKSPPKAAPLAQPITFKEAFSQFEQQEFEFERLNFAQESLLNFSLSTKQLQSIMNSFKYDQTRLTFLKSLLAKQSKKTFSISLILESFEYDLSRQEAQKMLNRL